MRVPELFPGKGNARDEEVAKLQRENARLKEENAILKRQWVSSRVAHREIPILCSSTRGSFRYGRFVEP